MRKQGSVSEFTSQRDAEIVKKFRRCLAQARVLDMDEIFMKVSRLPVERFYVSEVRALQVVKAYRQTGIWPVRTPVRREMFAEIDRRVTMLMSRRPELKFREAVFEVVNSPAPSFYLTPRSCRTLIYSVLQRVRRKKSGF
ncbi:MAG: hypothetical protein K2G75_07030 [Muribaculaceae bacterium]|nr:hypothetical protein [Muribaculaceae bacterium]MDE5925059.1 hypothetical protein [Muribaculaceae bacterium]